MKKIFKDFTLLASLLIALNSFADAQRPNVLLFMAEDLSARIGTFGDSVAVTPHIDELATQGVRYPNVFTTAGVCAPSRASQILGMHQISWGGQHMRAGRNQPYRTVPPANVKAYPELLRAAGYYAFNTNKLDYQFSNPIPAGAPYIGKFIGGGPFTIWDNDNASDTDWRNRATDQPFFGMINMLETHESRVFPPLGNWPNSIMHFVTQLSRSGKATFKGTTNPESIVVPPYFPDTPTVRSDMARHYDNIRQMDQRVGAVLAALKADGLMENTIVIWTTDHGDGLPRGKREIYDSGIKVPMVIRWPEQYRPADVLPGIVDKRLISFVDLAPTILKLAGVPTEYQHGVDLRDSSRQFIFASRDRVDEVDDRQRAIRDDRFKYIKSWMPEVAGATTISYRENIPMMREMRKLYQAGKLTPEQSLWFEAPGVEQLYDLETDPHELHNLANNPTFNSELVRLRSALDKWLLKIGDMSDIPEQRMAESFWPGGKKPTTDAPKFIDKNGSVTIQCATKGASIGYRLTGGNWELYTAPINVKLGMTLEAKSVRYGWSESLPVTFQRNDH